MSIYTYIYMTFMSLAILIYLSLLPPLHLFLFSNSPTLISLSSLVFFPKKICDTYLSDSDLCCPRSMISSPNHFLANTIIPFFLFLNNYPLCLFIPLTSLLCLFTPTFFIHSILYGSLPFPHTLVIANHVLIHL